MAIRLHSYLKRNRFGILYFRRVVPPHLRPYFAFKHVIRSLGTTRTDEARRLSRRFSESLDALFETVLTVAQKRRQRGLEVDMVVQLDFDELGNLKTVKTTAEPEEEAAVARVVPTLIQAARQPVVAALKAAVLATGPSLHAEIDKYLDEQTTAGVWRAQSALDIRGDFEQIKAILGDVPVAGLDHDTFNRLKDALRQLPANINKLPATRGKSIDEILALGLPPQSAVTVRKKWTRLTSFCEWLVGKGLMTTNLAKGKKPKAKAQSYEKFTTADLKALFESDEYRNGTFTEPFQYWLPILGLYTGARLEELAQLHLADIKQDAQTGIWFFDITQAVDEEEGADAAKTLKNKQSHRRCPIHAELIDLGLLRYADSLKARGADRLFPELRPDAQGKVGPRASEWFTEYRRSKGVGAVAGKSRKVFHSFRHTMNLALQNAEVPQELREGLCGHRSMATNVRVYGGELLLTVLKRQIDKLDYSITVNPFCPANRQTNHALAPSKR